jgi:hypothetical protein
MQQMFITTETSKSYQQLSKIFYFPSFPKSKAWLYRENSATAELIELAERHSSLLEGLEYDNFCDVLAKIISAQSDTNKRFANWVAVYQFVYNGRPQIEFLLELLEALAAAGQKEVHLPLSAEDIESSPLDEETKNLFLGYLYELSQR